MLFFRMARAVFEGTKWLMLKAATGIIDHGVKTRISVEKRAKILSSANTVLIFPC